MDELMCMNWHLSSWTSFSLREKMKRGRKSVKVVIKFSKTFQNSYFLHMCYISKSSRPLVSLGSQTTDRLLVRSAYIQWLQPHELQGQLLLKPSLRGSVRQSYRHCGRLFLKYPWYLCLPQF